MVQRKVGTMSNQTEPWPKWRVIYTFLFLIYVLPFITSPLSGPGLFDFLWRDFGWNIEYYVYGLFLNMLVMGFLVLHDYIVDRRLKESEK